MTTYNNSEGMQKRNRAKLLLKDDMGNNSGCKLCLGKARVDIRKISLLGVELSTEAGYSGRLEILLEGFQDWKESEKMNGLNA